MCAVKIVELRKAEDEVYGEEFEEFQRLSFDEKFGYLTTWMNEIVVSITELTRDIAKLQGSIREQEKMLEVVSKAVVITKSRNKVIRDVLKGKAKSMLDEEFFKKETDGIRKYTENLRYVI